jgi:hypothetical protein
MKQTLEAYYQEVLAAATKQQVAWLFPDAETCRDAYEDDCDVASYIDECIQEARACC